MIALSPVGLVALAAGAWVLRHALAPDPNVASDTSPWLTSTLYGLMRVLAMLAAAALVAAVILAMTPESSPSKLGSLNVAQLNELMEWCERWSDRTWIVLSFIGLALLVGIRVAKPPHAPEPGLGKFIKLLRSATFAKTVFALLAAASFVSSGIISKIAKEETEVQQAEVELKAAQLALARKVSAQVQEDIVQAALTQIAANNPRLKQMTNDYETASPFLFEARVTSVDVRPRAGEDALQGEVPDLPLDDVKQLDQEYSEAPSTEELGSELAELAFYSNASESVRHNLLELDNPLLSELVAAVGEPIVVEAWRRLAAPLARNAMARLTPRAELRAKIGAMVLSANLIAQLGDNASAEEDDLEVYEQPLGNPAWDGVREKLSSRVHQGLRYAKPETRADAIRDLDKFDGVWGAIGRLASSPSARITQEAAFHRYLAQDPTYAALWGYAVIALTPQEFGGSLKTVAVEDLAGSEKVDVLREVIVAAKKGDPDSQKALASFGIDAGQVSSLDKHQLAGLLYDHHGGYPKDGLMMYARETNYPIDNMRTYYETEAMQKAVGGFCPHQD